MQKASELRDLISKFIEKYGDLDIDATYWCEDCQDDHEGNGLRPEKTLEGKMNIEVVRLGECFNE